VVEEKSGRGKRGYRKGSCEKISKEERGPRRVKKEKKQRGRGEGKGRTLSRQKKVSATPSENWRTDPFHRGKEKKLCLQEEKRTVTEIVMTVKGDRRIKKI